MTAKAKLYIATVCVAGGWALFKSFSAWHCTDWMRFICYLSISVLVSSLKVNLPGIKGTLSVNFLFILIGISEMSLGETMAISCTGTLIQCVWRAKNRVQAVRVAFSICNLAVATYGAYAINATPLEQYRPILLLVAALVFFFLNTVPIAGVIAFTENKRLATIWRDCYFWSFPFYVGGASIAWVLGIVSREVHWHGSLILLPVLYFMYRSYRMYLGRLEDERKHVEEVANLHLRTIEALALAIEAKDQTTHEHLRRVRTYVEEIGREMGLPEVELDALRAAALLHDIGKLAVPEHIISKPGKMTPEEFEKMKIHPVVGAEILECVGFPGPVVPIVRAHHEQWDGSGYPHGLKGEEIPLGARILAAVDCLDALASDRQYRRAMPLDEAMAEVEALSGKAFDPAVVAVLRRRYRELEHMAGTHPLGRSRLSKDLKVEHGVAPATGFAVPRQVSLPADRDFTTSIAAARQEVHLLFELTRDLGTSLSLDETLSVVAARLRRMIPYDAIAVYIATDGVLVPRHVNGEDFRLFSSLRIPMGEGISGWVAANRKPIVNGNPSVEAGYLNNPSKFSNLRSCVAVPLEGLQGIVGVLTLYRSERDAFTNDNLRILLAISSKVSLSIENALKYRMAEDSATTDYLTQLPNARSLFIRLDEELARCRRADTMLTVLVCDLNGFKAVNDRFGHLAGNQILKNVAASVRAHCRPYDYVARMGGDEFVILLPGDDRKLIESRIDEFRQMSWGSELDDESDGVVSMSIGSASYPCDGTEPDALLAEADRRMYKAKQERKLARAVSELAGIGQPAATREFVLQ